MLEKTILKAYGLKQEAHPQALQTATEMGIWGYQS